MNLDDLLNIECHRQVKHQHFYNNYQSIQIQQWTFDSYFSADIIYTYDFDLNGKFDAEETDYIYNYAFDTLVLR